MTATKRIYLEPAWKLHSSFTSLLSSPPPGYEFVTVEGAAEKSLKLARRWGLSSSLEHWGARVIPIHLLRSFAYKFRALSEGVCLTYASAHVVLRKEPWVLDMLCESPYILAASDDRFSKWCKAIIRKHLVSSYCKKITFRFSAFKEEFLSYFGDERLKDKVAVVYWGVPRRDFVKNYRKEETVKILFMASADFNNPQNFVLKGGHELLAAFRELSKRYDNLELVLRSAVPSPMKKEFASNRQVRIIHRPIPWCELEREWRSADIFALPTWVTPGQGLLDALSYELPIVTTDVGGNSEIVEDGKTGFLVPRRTLPPLDRELVQALCHKLSILIENPELRRRMGKEARRTAEEKFSIEKRNETMKRVLDEATSNRGQ
jgi:glycosyltransferase involved in cell wall biosynthesis